MFLNTFILYIFYPSFKIYCLENKSFVVAYEAFHSTN